MQELLFKYLRRSTSKVEKVSKDILYYEDMAKQYDVTILPLVSDTYEIGIEIEVEKVGQGGNIPLYGVWQPHPDGSLRNNGMEFVSLPIKGRRIHYALNQFFDNLPAGYHFSPRTSIHIHLNVLDLLPKQIGAICLAYTPVEKLLYQFVGGNRDKNNFAVPVSETDFDGFIKLFINDEWALFSSYERHRYLGLNIDAVRKYGTLEFRHLGGTDNKEKIVNWINMIFRLKQFAVNNKFDDIKARIDRLNTDSQYLSYVTDIFGSQANLLNLTNLKVDMEGAVSTVKRFVVPNDFWKEIKSDFSDKSIWYQKAISRIKAPSWLSFEPIKPSPRPRRSPFSAPRTITTNQERIQMNYEQMRDAFTPREQAPHTFSISPNRNPWDAVGGLGIDSLREDSPHFDEDIDDIILDDGENV